jgi:hypothetical protein
MYKNIIYPSHYRLITTCVLLLLIMGMGSCKKIVSIDLPGSRLVSSSIFKDSLTAQAATNGMYSKLYNGSGSGTSFYSYPLTITPALSADETYAVQNSLDPFASNNISSGDDNVSRFWADSYNTIYNANSIIEGVAMSANLSPGLKNELSAEAKFIRAFCHFYLVNYFGAVPLVTTTNLNVTKSLGRSPVTEVYQQIISDLLDSKTELPLNYSWSDNDRTRPNSYAASALLARVYLYTNNWIQAETEASRVIATSNMYGINQDLAKVFTKTSTETIFQFYTNLRGFTYVGEHTVAVAGYTPSNALGKSLISAFEVRDNRPQNWISSVTADGINYPYAYKYKMYNGIGNNTELDVVLRLAETYLIRAEARMKQSNFQGAQDDLNVIRSRAGENLSAALTQTTLTTAIAHERQTELFYEWGHRWLDLKRTGQADVVLKAEKPLGWQTTDQLYPIPQSAMSTNSNLYQNPGYN